MLGLSYVIQKDLCEAKHKLPDQSHLQVYCQTRVTFKFTARPESPSSLLLESPSSLVPIKFTTSVTFKFTARVTFKFPPPFETVIDDRSSIGRYMCSVRAHSKLLKFTAQVYYSSLLLKFTCKFYPPANQAQIYEYHYTKEVSHIAECTYTLGRCTPHSN